MALTRLLRTTLALALLLALAPTALAAQDVEERWFIVEMQGQKAGWSVMRLIPGEDVVRTETELHIEIARGAASITVAASTWFEETPEGEPVAMSATSALAARETKTTYRFQGDVVEITESHGEHDRTYTVDAPEQSWLTPGAMQERVEKAIRAGAESFSLRMMDPSLGLQVIETTYQRVGPDSIRAAGKTVPATKWRIRNSAVPGGVTIEWLDNDGRTLRNEVNIGGLTLTLVASEKELALSPLDPPEIMASTLIPADAPIADPRETTRAEYLVSGLSDEAPPPSGGAQRVTALGDGRFRVFVDLTNVQPAPQSDVEESEYLADSAMINPADPMVRELAFAAPAPANASPAELAEALRRLTYLHVNEKSLDVGFASASEVCRTGEGDCSEHAVLLAALLRARGIPSRVASGVLYVDQFLGEQEVFGFHMWTQALLEEDGARRWVDLDATLPPGSQTNATHIILSLSSLAPGQTVNSMASLAPALGRMQIEVVSIE